MDQIRLSETLNSVRPSATIGMSQKARALMAAGEDVILLSQGEPDFDTPDHIIQAGFKALEQGKTRYTNVDGITELKQAIQAKFKNDNRLSYGLDQISVAPGGKAIIFNALLATLNPGDEVIIPAPCWVSYPEMTRLCGGVPIILPTQAATGFKPTAEDLASVITPRSKWLILNSPSNPTGSVLSSAEILSLAEVLKRHPDIMILMDDIYEHLIYSGSQFSTLAEIVPELYDRTLTMNGLSKAYAMTGWRLGYAGGPAWLIDAMRKVMGQSTSNPSTISQWAGVAALSSERDFLTGWLQAFEQRRDYVCESLNSMGLTTLVPEGAFYAFADCRSRLSELGLSDDVEFAEQLLSTEKVAIVPGTAFHAPGYFRLSFASSMDSLKSAMDRINRFII